MKISILHKCLFLKEIFDFVAKFLYLIKIFILTKFYFWPKFSFLGKSFIFIQITIIDKKNYILWKIYTFDQNFNFLPKFWFFCNFQIFRKKLQFLTKIFNFYTKFNFWKNWQNCYFNQISICIQIFYFDQKCTPKMYTKNVQPKCTPKMATQILLTLKNLPNNNLPKNIYKIYIQKWNNKKVQPKTTVSKKRLPT